MVVFVSVLAFAAVGRILAPLSTLGGTARSIESGDDLTRRIEVRGNDDIAELGHLFNAMLDRLEQAFALQREFVADAGHELRTPITIMRGHLRAAGRRPGRDRGAIVVTDELDRMSRFVEDLLTLAKAERPDFLMRRAGAGPADGGAMAKARGSARGSGQLRGDRRRGCAGPRSGSRRR